MEFEADTVNVKGLDRLLRAVKGKPPVARLGVLGGKSGRSGGQATNAAIGAAHEYGSPSRGLPARSFLRVPVSDNLGHEMDQAGAFTPEEAKEVVKKGTVTPWLTKVAVLAEGIVKVAFATRGYGKWPKWKDPDYKNNTGMVLVDTTQLRDSITYDVKEG